MTVQKTGNHVGFSCDSCPETFEDDEAGEFGEAWAAAKAQGWRAAKEGGDWNHYCPDCNRRRRTT